MSRQEAFDEGRMTNRPQAVVFDMDGTLADVSSIRHLVRGGNRNFDQFHQQSVDVPPNDHVVEMAKQAKAEGKKVVIVTARKAKYRNHTAMWLAQNDVPSDAMYMRHDKDGRPDYEVKKDILTRIHATLKPGGYLFLGASEALNGLPDLYQMVQCSPGIIYKVK